MKQSAFFLLFGVILGVGPLAWAMPSTITYQGTLKEGSANVNGNKIMKFRIVDKAGTTVYWSSAELDVKLTNGFFAQTLTPTDVPWQSITPYIEVSINGQALKPLEPLNASVYALISNDITDSAITPAKVAPGYGLVPSGAIMMFAGPCPTGWTHFSALDNRFPLGSNLSGELGGSSTHYHTILPHSHDVSDSHMKIGIGLRNVGYDNNLAIQLSGKLVGSYSAATAGAWSGYGNAMGNPASVGTNPNEVGVVGPAIGGSTELSVKGSAGQSNPPTSTESSMPPYLKVIFCQKN